MALKLCLGALFALVTLGSPAVSSAVGRQPWVLVDTKALTLTVFAAASGHILARFHNIAIGSGGTAEIHRHGDETTPLGTFHVAWIDRHSRFGTFYGFDYPTLRIALRAYAEGGITGGEFDAILDALRLHRIPPQSTPLGGQLGIHGLGGGNPRVQRAVNWTDGCVAVTNRDIRMLSRWVHLGTKVVIR